MFFCAQRQSAKQPAFTFCAALVVCGLFALAANPSAAQQSATPLWQKRPSATSPKPAPEVVRSTPVTVDAESRLAGDNARFSLMLADERFVEAEKIRDEWVGKAFAWHGTLQAEPRSAVNCCAFNSALTCSILTANGQSFRLRRDPDAGHVVEEIDLKKLPPEGHPTPAKGQRKSDAGDGGTCSTDGPSEIDIMVVYTQDARYGAGGAEDIEADIACAISQANETYRRSDISQRLRLVHVAEVAYIETGNTGPRPNTAPRPPCAGGLPPVLGACEPNDRDQLRAKSDGQADIVHELRDTHGADIVVMITETGNYCGYAYPMYAAAIDFAEDSAFAVVRRDCSTKGGLHSFVHELGHLMGAAHDWDTWLTEGETSMFPNNHGHAQLTASKPWRTMMAAASAERCPAGCPREMNFSNPNISLDGDATGVSGVADNAFILNNTAIRVANFRCSKR